ncbi:MULTISPECIES: hypothetical protein [Dyella]|uniref:DUF1772 domain-containing protein n=2 Tax=Dyella TaxID=231454 RepID=A0A4R0YRS6_9GAMM|nr:MULTISPECIES: hypothetical protein [Dyella]TBR40402.1 hypothetical protein EYV96_09665 [Dyella terrae]TCI12015.1 hypothetical protein EZM97_01205 [Dyella soli]
MNVTAAMTLGFAAIVSRWYLMLIAGKAWGGITRAHPEYAKALYASGLDMAFYGIGPLNWTPLFRQPVPADIRVTIRRLRRVVVISGLLGVAALAYVPATFLYAGRGG